MDIESIWKSYAVRRRILNLTSRTSRISRIWSITKSIGMSMLEPRKPSDSGTYRSAPELEDARILVGTALRFVWGYATRMARSSLNLESVLCSHGGRLASDLVRTRRISSASDGREALEETRFGRCNMLVSIQSSFKLELPSQKRKDLLLKLRFSEQAGICSVAQEC